MQIYSKIMYYLPSRKRTSIMLTWAIFVYLILIPVFYAVLFYYNGMINIRNLHATYENSDTADLEVYFYCIRMPWGLGTSAEIEITWGKEKLEISIPYKKWRHLEIFHINDKVKYKYLKTEKNDKDLITENNLMMKAKINFHIFNLIFNYFYKTDIDLFGQNKKNALDNDAEPFKLLDIISRVENDEIIAKAKLQPSMPKFININVNDFTVFLVEEHSGKLAKFLVNKTNNSYFDVLLTLNRENSENLKKFFNIVDNKDTILYDFASLTFSFEDDLPNDSNLNNALKMILKTFNKKIPNRFYSGALSEETKTLQPKSILSKIFSEGDNKTDEINIQMSIHESLFPLNLLVGLLKSLPFKDIPCFGQINDVNVIQGSFSQCSNFHSDYFSIIFKMKCTNYHLLFNTIEYPDESILKCFINDKKEIVAAFFSCISLFYNFIDSPMLNSLDEISRNYFESNNTIKKKANNNNLLRINTLLSKDQRSLAIKNNIESSNFIVGPFYFEFSKDFTYRITPNIELKFQRSEFSVDFSRPLINAVSFKERTYVEIILDENSNFSRFLQFMENKFDPSNLNDNTMNFEKLIQNIKFKILRMFNLFKYELEIFIRGDKLFNPLLDWQIEMDESLDINIELTRCDTSEVVIKFQNEEDVPYMAQCNLTFDKPKFHFQINETGFTIFPDSKKNIVLLDMSFNKVLYYPFKVDFKNNYNNNTFSSIISDVLKKHSFVYDRKQTNISKKRTEYLPVSNISQNRFKFLSHLSCEINSKSQSIDINGKILCYYNDDPFAIQRKQDEFYNRKSKYLITEDDKSYNHNKKIKFPIQIKPLEFRYFDSFVKINEIQLIPVNSRSIETQSEVIININFKIDTKKILEKNSEIKCKYGDEEFIIYYNREHIVNFIHTFSRSSGKQWEDIIEVISYNNLSNDELNKRENEIKILYIGDRLIYLEKITRLIRRLNLNSYPSAFSFESTLKFKFDEFEAEFVSLSEFPILYDNSKISQLQITFKAKSFSEK